MASSCRYADGATRYGNQSTTKVLYALTLLMFERLGIRKPPREANSDQLSK
ncbi:hypothetical protein THF1C08_670014 [Vibrio jasicida]|nr:hypothetical protein THF1C08_670014 [Vibrio jasicida]